jgi:hypothetical protein
MRGGWCAIGGIGYRRNLAAANTGAVAGIEGKLAMTTRIAFTALIAAVAVAICTPVRAEGNASGSHRPATFKAGIFQKGSKQSSGWTKPHGIGGAGRDSVKTVNAIGLVVPGIGARGLHHPDALGHQDTGLAGHGIQGNWALGGRVEANLHAPSNAPNKPWSPPASTAGVNGTTVSHIASGPANVGGTAHNVSGINGTTMRRKF